VGQPLARCGADIVVGVQQQRDGVTRPPGSRMATAMRSMLTTARRTAGPR
jgi:hypothetical protein